MGVVGGCWVFSDFPFQKCCISIRAMKRPENGAARKSRCGKGRRSAPPPSRTAAPGVPRGIRREQSSRLRPFPLASRDNAPGKPQFPAGLTRENHLGRDIFGKDAWTGFPSQENWTMRRGIRQSDRPTGRKKGTRRAVREKRCEKRPELWQKAKAFKSCRAHQSSSSCFPLRFRPSGSPVQARAFVT